MSGPVEMPRSGTAGSGADAAHGESSEERSLETLREALRALRLDLRRESRSAPTGIAEPAMRTGRQTDAPTERPAESPAGPTAEPPAEPKRQARRRTAREARPQSQAAEARIREAVSGFDRVRRVLGTLGMAERTGDVDAFGMDRQFLRQLAPALDFLLDRYWRVDVYGRESLMGGPLLIVANHSGLLPYDGLMLSHAAERIRKGTQPQTHQERPPQAPPRRERPHFMVADALMTRPFAQSALARVGGVRACAENAARLLRTGHSVIFFPEGAGASSKMFAERYRLGRFVPEGVLRAAVETGVPVVPVGIVGAEEANPLLYKALYRASMLAPLATFIPVTPTFPWLGPLGLLPLPTKWIFEVGEPIAEDAPEVSTFEEEQFARELRSRVQELVDRALVRRESVWG